MRIGDGERGQEEEQPGPDQIMAELRVWTGADVVRLAAGVRNQSACAANRGRVDRRVVDRVARVGAIVRESSNRRAEASWGEREADGREGTGRQQGAACGRGERAGHIRSICRYSRGVERAADWDAQWRAEPLNAAAVRAEERTPRWRAQERLIRERFGSFVGLKAVELGSGRGLNALLYASRGAEVTLVDTSRLALDQATELFAGFGAAAHAVEADIFVLPDALKGGFDVAMSFGLCEHFIGERRTAAVRAHLALARPGGLVLLGVPNRHAPAYRLWMATLKRRGTWPLGTEEPFSEGEIVALAAAAGGEPLDPIHGSFVASLVDHGLNQVLYKLGGRGVRVPQTRVPLLDRFSYELLLPVVRR